MDKQRFRIDKNEKLIAFIEKKPSTIINNYNSEDTDLPQAPQTIMGKPIIVDTTPRDGQALVYNAEDKQWEAGNVISESGGNVDGGEPDSVYGGVDGIDGEGV